MVLPGFYSLRGRGTLYPMVHCFKLNTVFKASGHGAPFCLATSTAISRVHVFSFHKFSATSKHVPIFPQISYAAELSTPLPVLQPTTLCSNSRLAPSFARAPGRLTRCREQHLYGISVSIVEIGKSRQPLVSQEKCRIQFCMSRTSFSRQKVSFRHTEGWSGCLSAYGYRIVRV